jgi:mono/diheme cytochrome c family protein
MSLSSAGAPNSVLPAPSSPWQAAQFSANSGAPRAAAAASPAWGRILDEATIKKLAIYVHSLGGGA